MERPKWWPDNGLAPAQSRHREAVLKQISGAWSNGYISPYAREMLRHGVTNAATLNELSKVQTDLEARVARAQAAAESEMDADPGPPPTSAENPILKPKKPARPQSVALAFVAAMAALLVVSGILAIVALVSWASGIHVPSGDDHVDTSERDVTPSSAHFGETHLLDKDGMWTMNRDLNEKFGSAKVVRAVVHDKSATITRRSASHGGRVVYYSYDGEKFVKLGMGQKKVSRSSLVDLDMVDVPATADLIDAAPHKLGIYRTDEVFITFQAIGPYCHVHGHETISVHGAGEGWGRIHATLMAKELRRIPPPGAA